MSRCPQPTGTKGSLRWIQRLVEHHPTVLNAAIGLGPIRWVSPRADDDWAEYRDATALTRLGVAPAHRPLDSFWPARGPQWDALGRAESGEAVLVEAKAHIAELLSPPSQARAKSLERIRRSLRETATALKASPGTDWTRRFYQYTNRLAHGHFLHTINKIPTRLVFLHVVGDADMHGPTSRAAWEAALTVLHEALGLRGRLPRYVTSIFIDVRPSTPVVV